MIRYTLRCEKSHEFETWFRSSDDYDRTALARATTCPICGSTMVEKAPMAPSLARKDRSEASGEKQQFAAAPDPKHQEVRAALKELRKQVTENADYVGDRFPDEARRMHYREIDPRSIYGEASREEAQALADEGVEFQPLPAFPEDGN